MTDKPQRSETSFSLCLQYIFTVFQHHTITSSIIVGKRTRALLIRPNINAEICIYPDSIVVSLCCTKYLPISRVYSYLSKAFAVLLFYGSSRFYFMPHYHSSPAPQIIFKYFLKMFRVAKIILYRFKLHHFS